MGYRDDFRDALNHRQPARIPVDFGATPVSGIHVLCMARLREYYGLESRPVIVDDPYQMLGSMEEDLREVMGVTVVGASSPAKMFGLIGSDLKSYRTPWGQEVLVPCDFETVRDAAGNEFIYPQGDRTVPPSGRMAAGSYFFDSIIRQPSIREDELDYRDNVEEFGPATETDLSFFRREVQRVGRMDAGVIGRLPGTGLGDIAHVPGPGLKHPRGIRDVAEWYISTVARTDYVHSVFEAQTKIALKNLPLLWDALGDSVDAVFVCGTDFGTQNSQFCSAATFDSLYAPYYKRINDWIHRNTSWKTFKHSCGAVVPLLSRFIKAGFDILNPVQCSAAGMDPAVLKKEFGDRLVFWGGGVDTQHTLPFGTPDEVRDQVLRRCEIFGRDGGFVFGAIHNVQADTPIENVVAMIDAVKAFNSK